MKYMKVNILAGKPRMMNLLPVLLVFFLSLQISCMTGNKDQSSDSDRSDTVSGHPAWTRNANIYEVNIRQYTPEGTFRAFESHLPRLREIGVDILWLMPIHPIGEKNRKGELGSYYAVRDYKLVNPEFGTLDEFKGLVRKAHKMGFHVILDWVANHTSWDNPWLTEHPDWYTQDSSGNVIYPSDWTDVADLNYDNLAMRKAMIDALEYWVIEADIDGYRCDVAGEVPVDFWEEARRELDSIKPVFMLAEAEKPEHHRSAFDMSYAWELHHIFNDIAQGKKNAGDLERYFIKQDTVFPASAYRMTFITNHDENSWNGTVKERMGEAGNVFAVLSYTLPGMPLIYSGQEAGLDKRLAFFAKDTITWDFESPLNDLYARLNHLKNKNPALWNGEYGGEMRRVSTNEPDRVFAFTRTKGENELFVVTNLSDQDLSVSIQDENISGTFRDVFSGSTDKIVPGQTLDLGKWSYRVWLKE